MAIKVDQLIDKFKEFKEELSKAICPYTGKDAKLCPADCPCKKDMKKNVNMSYKPQPMVNMTKQVAPPATMNMSENVEKQMISASPGGAQDAMRMAEKGETKHDRCARKVGAKGDVENPHAVCVAAGVEPEKWKKSSHEKLSLAKNGQWSLDKCGTNEEASPNPPHNKGKFKVMPMAPETKSKKEDVKGHPFDGKDKETKK